MSNNNNEETKINFFNPHHYNDGKLPYEIEKDEDNLILEAKIDPQEWRKEIDRVYADLENIEKGEYIQSSVKVYHGTNGAFSLLVPTYPSLLYITDVPHPISLHIQASTMPSLNYFIFAFALFETKDLLSRFACSLLIII